MIRVCIWLVERFLRPELSTSVVGDLLEQRERGSFWILHETVSALWFLHARPQPGDGVVTRFVADLRIAARLLRRSPAFTTVSVLTLGLAIGATAAIFSVIEPVLLRSLPYPEPERIVFVWERTRDGGRDNVGYATYRDLAAASKTIEHSAALADWQPTLSGENPERVTGLRVSWQYFRTLGVRPALGRDFLAEEDVEGKQQVVVLSHGLWQRRYGSDRSIVGRTISINDAQMTVVGVMPQWYDDAASPTTEIWRVLGYGSQTWACRSCRHLRMLARIRPGVTMEAASRELDMLTQQIQRAYPKEYASVGGLVVPMQAEVTRSIRPALVALSAAVLLVLLIAVANVINLQLARAVRRQGEFAIRTALGAARSRLLAQLTAEGLLLATLGGAAGLLVARTSLPLLVANLPPALPRLSAIHLSAGALVAVSAIVLVVALIMGLAPAARGTGDLGINLRSGRRLSGGQTHTVRITLVVGEVALAMMLLVTAGLVGRSMLRLLDVNPGFDPERLLTLEINSSGANYKTDASVWAYHDRVRELVNAIPGVTTTAVANQLPLGGNVDMYGVTDPRNPPANPEMAPSADRYVVSNDYFATMRIPIVRGRAFTKEEAADTNHLVAIVSEGLAQILWPGANPLGQLMRVGRKDREVIGVAGNVRHGGLDATTARQWYVPEHQWMFSDNQEVLVVRSSVDPASLAGVVRQTVASVDPTQPVVKIATMDQVIAASTSQRRLALVLFSAFASAALLLAIAGIYGVVAGSVAERTREIGVRSALGATPGEIVSLVVSQGGKLSAIGIVLGLVGSLAVTRYLQTFLFGVGPNDPLTLAGVVILLGVVTVVACLIPAARAARVDPSGALRSE